MLPRFNLKHISVTPVLLQFLKHYRYRLAPSKSWSTGASFEFCLYMGYLFLPLRESHGDIVTNMPSFLSNSILDTKEEVNYMQYLYHPRLRFLYRMSPVRSSSMNLKVAFVGQVYGSFCKSSSKFNMLNRNYP